MVLLRKIPTGIVSWGSVRPISVAATLYRMWSKMRTTQLMTHARTLATSTVRPCLSTRSIWGIQVEIIAEYLASSISPCGLVLDLVKAFNVVCRPFLKSLMLRLGFQPTVVEAWFSCLDGLSRQALVAGAVYGTSKATTGIPEGDPLSVVGMFALCCLFREVVSSQDSIAFPFSYADNWEVVTGDVSKLLSVLRALDEMSNVCRLPVLPNAGRGLSILVSENSWLLVLCLVRLFPSGLLVVALALIWLILTERLRPHGMIVLPVGIVGCSACVVFVYLEVS